MGIIKKRTIVDQTIYGETTADPFRKMAKTNWHNKTLDEAGTTVALNNIVFGGSAASTFDDSIIKSITIGDVTTNSDELFYEFSTPVRIIGDESRIRNDADWHKTISESITASVPYVDHAFSIDIPFTSKEAASIGATNHTKITDIELSYNFLDKAYESAIAGGHFKEPILPNIYAFASTSDPDLETNPAFKDLITLGGALDEGYVLALNSAGKSTEIFSQNKYLDAYITLGKSTVADQPRMIENLVRRFEHMFVPIEQVSVLNDVEDYKYYFPMHTEITIQTDTNTQFAQMLQDSGIACTFMKDMFENLFQISDSMSYSNKEFIEQYQSPQLLSSDEGNPYSVQNSTIYQNTRRTVDIESWWESSYNASSTPIGKQGIFLGELSSQVKAATSDEFEFYKNMIMIIMAGKLRTLISENIRTFDEIMEGNLAYSETLMYRVAKFHGSVDANNTSAIPIQNFWIPNSNDVNIIKLIDTQIKYNKQYTYVVYAYQAVLGVEYEYSDLKISRTVSQNPAYCIELIDQETDEAVTSYFDDTEQMIENPNYSGVYETSKASRYVAEFKSTYRPSFKMVEVPLMRHTARMYDDPPLSPEIDIIPYIGVSSKIRFLLSGRMGEEVQDPISFNEADEVAFADLRQSKSLQSFEPITFSSDDTPYQFEVYRTTRKPKTFKDIAASRAAIVVTNISKYGEPKYAAAAAYEDTIVPNIKYYYVFRARDQHGWISNPSPVYEFEMVDDGSSVFPLYKTIELEHEMPTTVHKKGRRLLYLIPNARHRLINEDASGFSDVTTMKGMGKKMVLGIADDPVWDNKFKIRLTSKKTGRKIDLNIEFETEHIVTEIEQN